MATKDPDQISPQEAARRRDAVTRAMIAMPPKRHEPLNAKRKRKGLKPRKRTAKKTAGTR